MNQRLFLVDVESTGPSPATSVMTEFGVVDFETREWFHGHIWDFEPTPGNPALPIATKKNVGFTGSPCDWSSTVFNGVRQSVYNNSEDTPVAAEVELFATLDFWIRQYGNSARPVFVSDNPGFDFMWMAYGFDSAGLENPFGHSSRRIGDFAAGLSGRWIQQNKWKGLRKTRHTHNPVDDAMGNAEALEQLLKGTK